MARAGDLEIDGALYPIMQQLTAKEILDDKRSGMLDARARQETRQKQMDLPEQNQAQDDLFRGDIQ